jgi:4-hydroxythreonine-4-phosphate dehydrogenase
MPMSKRAEADAPLLVTMGEPCGVGPEVAVAAFTALNGREGRHKLKLVGDPRLFKSLGDIPDDALIPAGEPVARTPGKLSLKNSATVIAAIETAVAASMNGSAAGLVTAPIQKSILAESGFPFPGHTEFLAHLTGAPLAVMMLASEALRVVPLSIHLPLSDVPKKVTKDAILATGRVILAALKRDFGIASPRLAVAGLNPHAGEDGVLGPEEAAIIAPAIAELRNDGATILGPLSADTMFHDEARKNYDAALCMYHDQALIPIKTLSFWDGVNVTLGLPIVRTSPDHGTALDIAGTGKADPRSMIAAIKRAGAMADERFKTKSPG